MPISATGVTVVNTGGVILFEGLGSLIGLPPDAELVRLPASEGAITVNTRFVVAPAARLATDQTTWEPLTAAAGEAFTNVTVAGRLSVTLKLLAEEGPRFVTVIV